ncbi:hypothetical protein Q604_UNBC12553G0001, partial [human gut metagenome]
MKVYDSNNLRNIAILGIFSVNSSDFSVPTCIGFVASITITAAA